MVTRSINIIVNSSRHAKFLLLYTMEDSATFQLIHSEVDLIKESQDLEDLQLQRVELAAVDQRQQKELQKEGERNMEEKRELDLHNEPQRFRKEVIALSCSNKREKFVEVGELLAQSDDKHRTTHVVVDQCTQKESILHTWKLRIVNPESKKLTEQEKVCESFRLKDLLTKLDSIEQEMQALLKLSSDSVVKYEAYKILRKSKKITIYLLQPYIIEHNLSYFLKFKLKLTESYLKYIARKSLQSLAYLHEHGIAHRDLKVSNIYMDSNSSPSFRIADYSVERQVCEAVLGYQFMAAQLVYPIPTRKNKQKGDVYRLGGILISLAKGRRCNKIDSQVLSEFSPEFLYFLERCRDPNEVTRWSAANLLEHSVFAEHPSRSLDDSLDEGTTEDSISNQEKEKNKQDICVLRPAAEGDNPDDAITIKNINASEE